MTQLYYYEPRQSRAERKAEERRYRRNLNIIYTALTLLGVNVCAMLLALFLSH